MLGPENTEILMGAIRLHELDEVATKRDLAELKTELMAEIGDVRGELAQLRVDVTAEIGSLRKTMTNWMLTVLVTVVGAMASLTLLA